MKFVFFYHSVISDWNHGNAHFLRGVLRELQGRGFATAVYEPRESWSRNNLVADHGPSAIRCFEKAFPELKPKIYDSERLDLEEALEGADVVLVHEFNPPELIAAIGRHRARGGKYRLFFHDTHHRSASLPEDMALYDLDAFDGVLAFGEVIREIYMGRGWSRHAWTWHEAADTSVFRPMKAKKEGDLVWVGNWGDEERTAELEEFLLRPCASLRLRANLHGVRYPLQALEALGRAGIEYHGWLANYRVPEVFSRHLFTVHVLRRPYVRMLPGIPTIRVFEALSCGIPLISSPWDDVEGLFRPGVDFLTVRSGDEMEKAMRAVLRDDSLARSLAESGQETIMARHTCAHRVEELFAVCRSLGVPVPESGFAGKKEVA